SQGRVLFATWHSQYNAAVGEAKRRLVGRQVMNLTVTWKEDVRRWHPGQAWIWSPGGFGVFDPGINGLSMVSRIMPMPVFVKKAELALQSNCAAPIATKLELSTAAPHVKITAEFDWRQTGPQTWNIEVDTADGDHLLLENGGAKLSVNGKLVLEE